MAKRVKPPGRINLPNQTTGAVSPKPGGMPTPTNHWPTVTPTVSPFQPGPFRPVSPGGTFHPTGLLPERYVF